MATARDRNPRGEGARLRPEIVRSAADLLDRTGDASAVTLRAVARGAGISAPSIYAHFPHPQAILLAVVQEEFDALAAELHAAVDSAGPSPAERLRACCAGYLQYAAERPQRYLVMFGGVWNAAPAMTQAEVDRADVAALGRPVLDTLVALVEARDARRRTRTDPRADAVALWVGLHGLAHQRIVSTAFDWPDGVEERLLERLAGL